jgi:cytochrome c oxidase assembly protein subunit 15
VVQLIVALTVLSVYLLMVLGGLVTSTGSGLACPDWPLCYGTVAPPLKVDIWLEWGHRLLGGITGLLILASTVLVCRRYRNASRVTAGATLALLVGVVVLGGVVVLVDAPLLRTAWHTLITSSHIVLSTLILVSLVFTYALVRTKDPGTGRLPFAVPFFALVGLQSLVGVVVRYSAAGGVCPDFPTCQGMWVPPLESFQILVHLGHRILAVAVFVFAAAVLIKKPSALTALTFGIVAAQAAWGVLSVLTGLFLPVVFLHIATGFFLIGWTAYHAAPALFFPPLIARSASA